MLTHVYIRGNVGDPANLKIFDLSTDKLVPDVKRVSIVANASGLVEAGLIRTQHPDVIVIVEPGPKHPLAGAKLYDFRMEVERNPILCATLQKAQGDEYTVGDNGQLMLGSTYQVNHGVSDVDLLSYVGADPLDPIYDSMKLAFRDMCKKLVRVAIAEALMKITKAGGVRSLTGNYATGGVVKKSLCIECFGTGLKGGFMQPCSKGCSP